MIGSLNNNLMMGGAFSGLIFVKAETSKNVGDTIVSLGVNILERPLFYIGPDWVSLSTILAVCCCALGIIGLYRAIKKKK